jgi:predicted  nucleic acid-binding Zn-ribbon protein
VQYEVGAPLKPNLLLDLTALWPRKLQAMQCYKSQQQSQDYAKHIEALNIYRTYSLPASVTHAEAYLVLKPEEVLQAASENRWMNSVLSAAEVGAEALQLQVISKDQLIARLQDQGRIDIQAMRDHEQALLKRIELLGDELSQLGIENERKRVEIERLSNVTVAVQDELSLVKNSLAHTQNELAHEQAQRQIMLNSNSWRITKPLRWFMQLFSSNQS